ncbi:hypothetical protein C2E23DRAFT_801645 [Lenzites betulinus]|nr:hypothetical protein C2E23DRAFT_801645 [Lenzites betulinus]
MGFCFSCCTSRRKRSPRAGSYDDDDREPLLNASSRIPGGSSDPLPAPKNVLEKVADVIAALNAGKLPSQEQLDRALRKLLASGILDTDDSAGVRGTDTLEDACQAVLQFGMEKNDDDTAQDLVYQLKQIADIPVHADIAVDTAEPGKLDMEAIAQELPSSQEASSDAATLVRSLYSLFYVLATSAAFRLVLSDILLIARQTTADVAAQIGNVAEAVEKAAGAVEETVRPGGGTLEDVKAVAGDVGGSVAKEVSGGGPISAGVAHAAEAIQQESPEAVKEAVLRRLQEVKASRSSLTNCLLMRIYRRWSRPTGTRPSELRSARSSRSPASMPRK